MKTIGSHRDRAADPIELREKMRGLAAEKAIIPAICGQLPAGQRRTPWEAPGETPARSGLTTRSVEPLML